MAESTKARRARVRETGVVYHSIRAALLACGLEPSNFYVQVQKGKPCRGFHIDVLTDDDPSPVQVPRQYRRTRQRRQLRNLSTGEVFESYQAAAEHLGMDVRTFYRRAIYYSSRVDGAYWAYVDQEPL